MKNYNVVTNYKIIKVLKSSKYFRVNLGMAVTMDKNGERLLSDKDQFAASYNYQYKTMIYGQGNIGGIKFYTDHYIHDDKLAVYYNLEEFVFDYDEKFISENGVDAYLGHILKSVDDMYAERMEKVKQEAEEKEAMVGSPEKLIKSPGSVTYEDLKRYMQEKRSI